ncbi:hypothetical protein GO986_17355 [Deinococcus sp. HMF7620]|uniref:Uncharacterized protein n=1 Tax=Deinococcus arboris TaxID=2682977 RepID=A0A7C9I0P5_9DEIO|nr:hypothetical protein [Deinococcus arboris]MVN88510.1 hypothetical protein [Deinococcus arboris]
MTLAPGQSATVQVKLDGGSPSDILNYSWSSGLTLAFGNRQFTVTNVAAPRGTSSVKVTYGREATATLKVIVPPTGRIPVSSLAVIVDPALPDVDTRTSTIPEITRRLYAEYRDEADFIFLVMNRTTKPDSAPYGMYFPVKNDTEGLGITTFDQTADYGSAGTLQGVMYFPYRAGIESGPSLHELAHRWANDAVESDLPSHFGFSSAGRQLGGFDDATFNDLGNGQYQASITGRKTFGTVANGGNSVAYSDVELYLMGLLAPSEVNPFRVARNAAWVDAANGVFRADAVIGQRVQDIISQHGARSPAFGDAQKTFRLLTVMVSKTTPSEAELLDVAEGLGTLTYVGDDGNPNNFTFNEATRGRGVLRVLAAPTLRK